MNKINYDILVYIIEYLDPESIFNLLLTNKNIYNIYLQNTIHIDNIIANKILKYLTLENIITERDIVNNIQNKYNIYLQLNHLYLSKTHKEKTFGHLLVLLSKYTKNDCTFLFQKILNQSVFKFWTNNPEKHIHHFVSSDNLEQILIYSNKEITNLILYTKRYIQPGILSYVIRYLLSCSSFEKDYVNKKIIKFIKYILQKNNNDVENKMYIHDIFVSLIVFDKLDIMKYIVNNNYCFDLNYNLVINKAIEYDKIEMLRFLFSEYKKHNSNSLCNEHSYFKIIIDTKSIKNFIKIGEFKSIKYILKYMLGNYINTPNYIWSICEGLTELFETISENYQNDMYIFSVNNLKKLNYLSFYLSINNKILINKHLILLQQRLQLNKTHHVFLEAHPLTLN